MTFFSWGCSISMIFSSSSVGSYCCLEAFPSWSSISYSCSSSLTGLLVTITSSLVSSSCVFRLSWLFSLSLGEECLYLSGLKGELTGECSLGLGEVGDLGEGDCKVLAANSRISSLIFGRHLGFVKDRRSIRRWGSSSGSRCILRFVMQHLTPSLREILRSWSGSSIMLGSFGNTLKLKENLSRSSSILSLNSSNLSSEVISQVVPRPVIRFIFNLKSSIYLL